MPHDSVSLFFLLFVSSFVHTSIIPSFIHLFICSFVWLFVHSLIYKFIHSIILYYLHIQGTAFNVTHFESRITHLLYTAINTTEHGQVSQCLGFKKSLTSSIQRLGDVLPDNQGIAAIFQVHVPRRDVECPA
jgi:hypothetical protein